MPQPLDVHSIRPLFPGLARRHGDAAAVFFDGPAGSQVPRPVVDAMAHYLLHDNANHGGVFATSVATDAMVQRARQAGADLLAANDAEEVVFGANMTTLTLHLSRALSSTWRAGDEVVVTQSDHDANVMPWRLAARDAGATVRVCRVHADSTLDVDHFASLLSAHTRLCAFGAASNLSGTLHPVRELCALAREKGALSFVDAVHFAPHHRMDVRQWGCDFAVCSAYKFFGPHLGLLWGRGDLLADLPAYKVRPAADHGAEKWQTGTANFEGIAGTLAAIDYLASLGSGADRRQRLDSAFAAIGAHERQLCARLLRGLQQVRGLLVVGLGDPAQVGRRCPTVAFTLPGQRPQALAEHLAAHGVHCWPGNSYALALSEALGLEPDGALRVGMLHYNTVEEVDRLLAVLDGVRH